MSITGRSLVGVVAVCAVLVAGCSDGSSPAGDTVAGEATSGTVGTPGATAGPTDTGVAPESGETSPPDESSGPGDTSDPDDASDAGDASDPDDTPDPGDTSDPSDTGETGDGDEPTESHGILIGASFTIHGDGSWDFGSLPPGASRTHGVTLRVTLGQETLALAAGRPDADVDTGLTVRSITVGAGAGAFTVDDGCAGVALEPDESCEFSVTFVAPDERGEVVGVLRVDLGPRVVEQTLRGRSGVRVLDIPDAVPSVEPSQAALD